MPQQHRHQRQIDRLVHLQRRASPPHPARMHRQPAHESRAACSGRCAVARLRKRTARKARRHIGQPMRRMRRIDEIGVEHQVIAHAAQASMPCCVQRAQRRLQVMHRLRHRRIFEQRLAAVSPSAEVSDSRSARPSSAETATKCSRSATASAALCVVDDIQQRHDSAAPALPLPPPRSAIRSPARSALPET